MDEIFQPDPEIDCAVVQIQRSGYVAVNPHRLPRLCSTRAETLAALRQLDDLVCFLGLERERLDDGTLIAFDRDLGEIHHEIARKAACAPSN